MKGLREGTGEEGDEVEEGVGEKEGYSREIISVNVLASSPWTDTTVRWLSG